MFDYIVDLLFSDEMFRKQVEVEEEEEDNGDRERDVGKIGYINYRRR